MCRGGSVCEDGTEQACLGPHACFYTLEVLYWLALEAGSPGLWPGGSSSHRGQFYALLGQQIYGCLELGALVIYY